jgi:hypothetical protein
MPKNAKERGGSMTSRELFLSIALCVVFIWGALGWWGRADAIERHGKRIYALENDVDSLFGYENMRVMERMNYLRVQKDTSDFYKNYWQNIAQEKH